MSLTKRSAPRTAAVLTALLGAACAPADGPPDARTAGALLAREVWISPWGTAGDGSFASPYVATTSAELDALMASFADPASPRYLAPGTPAIIHLNAGTFQTRGNAEWSHDNWRLLDDWTLAGAGRDETVLEMDPYAVQSFPIIMPSGGQYFSQQKLSLVLGDDDRGTGHPPRRQRIKDLTLNGNFSKLVREGFFAGKPLKLGGVHLYGEGSAIENVRFTDYGSTYGAQETFVAIVEGAGNNSVPTATVLDGGCTGSDCVHISDCVFDGPIDPIALTSGMQITVFSIFGSYNGDYGNRTNPNRVDLLLQNPYMARNRVIVDETNQTRPGGEGNLVQGFSILNGENALVSDNVTIGARMGFYSDSLRQKNLTITANRFERAMIGVAFFVDLMPDFGDDGVTISNNMILTIPWNDGARTGIYIRRALPSIENETWEFYPPSPNPRHLRNFTISGNTVGFSSAPAGAYANVGIEIHEVEGLTLTNNAVDSRMRSTIELGSIVRRDAAGHVVAVYDNTGVINSGNVLFTGTPPTPPSAPPVAPPSAPPVAPPAPPPPPPAGSGACAQAVENERATVSCPAGQIIRGINFASYGTPAGSCGGGYAVSSCDAASSKAVVESACLGLSACSVAASNLVFGDPCYGTVKRLFIEATCGSRLALDGEPCSTLAGGASSTECASGYCYPGPAGQPYCIAGTSNCAKPGTSGIMWNESYEWDGRTYTCVYGVGLQ